MEKILIPHGRRPCGTERTFCCIPLPFYIHCPNRRIDTHKKAVTAKLFKKGLCGPFRETHHIDVGLLELFNVSDFDAGTKLHHHDLVGCQLGVRAGYLDVTELGTVKVFSAPTNKKKGGKKQSATRSTRVSDKNDDDGKLTVTTSHETCTLSYR